MKKLTTRSADSVPKGSAICEKPGSPLVVKQVCGSGAHNARAQPGKRPRAAIAARTATSSSA